MDYMTSRDGGFFRIFGRSVAVAAAAGLLASCADSAGDAGDGADSAEMAAEPADIPMQGSRIFPESITSDAAGNIYVGSTQGTIYRALAGAEEAVPWIAADEENGLQSLFGVFVDDGRGLLWACSNPDLFGEPDPDGTSELLAFDLETGALQASHDFPAGPAACNDIAIAEDGTVWVTETLEGRIFTLAPDADELTLFASGDDLVGVDGIAFAGDGAIYINNVREHLLQRVERAEDGSYSGLTTLDLSEELNGPDGLRALGGNRFIQAEGPGGRVALITVNGDEAEVEPVRTGLESSPAVTVVDDVAYALEGKINYLVDPALEGEDPGPFIIRAIALPEAP